MKTKLISFLLLLTIATSYAQITTPAGIAVQGIAKDNNNTARVNKKITLKFEFYYGTNLPFSSIDKSVETDAFGVFSTVLEPGAANNILIANNDTFLKISEGTTEISNERLRQVPYAISATHADNGVPTGAIMPFIGSTAPAGWVFCDGGDLPIDGSADALMVLLDGSKKAPNLNGRFLKGAGAVASGSKVEAIAVKAFQDQSTQTKEHLHAINKFSGRVDNAKAVESGPVPYAKGWGRQAVAKGDDGTVAREESPLPSDAKITGASTEHGHSFTIPAHSTAENSVDNSEVRPSSYGVNYIIKL
jgi:microcystin-dependent protein